MRKKGNLGKSDKIEPKKRVRYWIFALLFQRGVLFFLALTIAIFVIYIIGSIPDPGISDRILFLLLRLLWYSSLLLCLFSLFSLGYKVRRLVNRPSLRIALGVMLYFTAGVFGAALAIINSFIIVASGGNY